MHRVASILAASLLSVLPANAEVLVSTQDNVPDDGTLTLTLPAGPVEITMNTVEGTGLFVHAGGSYEVLLDSAHMPRLLKTYENSALLELYTGGNACPILFAWVTFDENGLRSSGDFGTCAEQANFEETGLGPVVTMDDLENAGQTVSYIYDEVAGNLSELDQ